jgi:GNAT acetyltransferase-like protein
MSRIRPFVVADVSKVAELHESIFAGVSHLNLETRRRYLQQVFLENPWCDDSLPSLVGEGENGQIVGFLGVLPRRMSWNGRPITVAIISQFMVAPDHRGVTGFLLLKTFLAGHQDLSMTDGASHESVKIWKATGGTDSPLHSLHWTRPLRPLRYGLSFVTERAPLLRAAAPLCAVADAVATRMRRSPFRLTTSASGEALTVDLILDHADQLVPRAALRPEYDRASLTWLLEMAGQKASSGDLRKVLVRNADHEVIGWYLYYLRRRGSSEVLQIVAGPDKLAEVLEHLYFDAWREGALAVSGRLEPGFLEALRATHCLFHGRGSPLLIHSPHRELVDAVRRGDAFLTRLDGEWWMSFQDG